MERIRAQFYERNPFSVDTIREHTRRTSRLWGKHMLALAYRNNGARDLRCRFALLSAGMRLLGNGGRLSVS